MYMELVSIYCNNNNNKEILDTFCDKNLSSVLLNIVVRIVTSWLQIIYSTWSTDDCVCVCVCVCYQHLLGTVCIQCLYLVLRTLELNMTI